MIETANPSGTMEISVGCYYIGFVVEEACIWNPAI